MNISSLQVSTLRTFPCIFHRFDFLSCFKNTLFVLFGSVMQMTSAVKFPINISYRTVLLITKVRKILNGLNLNTGITEIEH
jgi:hypothetical protein